MSFQLPDPSTPFGERVARRLRDERLIWLTTVDAKGIPQPTPVWFLWDGARLILPRIGCPPTWRNTAISSLAAMRRQRISHRSIRLLCASVQLLYEVIRAGTG